MRDARRARQREDIRVTPVKIAQDLSGVGRGERAGHGGFHGISYRQGFAAGVVYRDRGVVDALHGEFQRGSVAGRISIANGVGERFFCGGVFGQRDVVGVGRAQRVGVAAVGFQVQRAVFAFNVAARAAARHAAKHGFAAFCALAGAGDLEQGFVAGVGVGVVG